MVKQNHTDGGEDTSDNEALSPLIKAYIDQKVQDAAKQREESDHKKKGWRNSWRHASPLTRASLILSTFLAVSTIAYTIAAWRTLVVMQDISRDSSHQTDKLIDTANQIKNAGWVFSGAAQGTNNAVWGAVGKLNLQAGELENSVKQAGRLADAASRSADTAKEALIIANRPWVKVAIDQTGPLTFLSDGSAQIGLQEKIENIGSSVALRVFVWYDIMPFDSMPNPLRTATNRQKQSCDANRFPKSTMTGDLIFPHQPITYPAIDFRIPKEHVVPVTDKGLEGKVAFLLVGCASYRSSFEDSTVPSHETFFRYMIGKSEKGIEFLPYLDPTGTHPDYVFIQYPDGFNAN